MSGNLLLDTNVIIRFVNGVTELFSLFDDEEKLFVSSVTVGELMYGAEKSSKRDFNHEHFLGLCEALHIITPDADTAVQYGLIKAQLKKKGHPIPENDIWIAATAIAGDLTLVTSDSDFEGIDGLKLMKA